MTRLTVQDCLAAGYCVSGQRRFFAQHGIDYRAFVRDGIAVEDLAHIEDADLARAIGEAAKREARHG